MLCVQVGSEVPELFSCGVDEGLRRKSGAQSAVGGTGRVRMWIDRVAPSARAWHGGERTVVFIDTDVHALMLYAAGSSCPVLGRSWAAMAACRDRLSSVRVHFTTSVSALRGRSFTPRVQPVRAVSNVGEAYSKELWSSGRAAND